MVHANGELMRSFACLVSRYYLIYHTIRRVELSFSETSLNSRFVLCLGKKKLSRQKRTIILVSLQTCSKKKLYGKIPRQRLQTVLISNIL